MPTNPCGGDCTPQQGTHYSDFEIASIVVAEGVKKGVLTTTGPNGNLPLDQASRTRAATAVGIVFIESEGWSHACNPSSGASGWYQFMPFWPFYGNPGTCEPFDATDNMWDTYKAQGFVPWAPDLGRIDHPRAYAAVDLYQGNVSGSQGAPATVGGDCLAPTGLGDLNPIAWLTYYACLAGNFFAWIQNPLTWKILGLTVAGGILLLFGLGLLAFDAFKKEAPSIAGALAKGMVE